MVLSDVQAEKDINTLFTKHDDLKELITSVRLELSEMRGTINTSHKLMTQIALDMPTAQACNLKHGALEKRVTDLEKSSSGKKEVEAVREKVKEFRERDLADISKRIDSIRNILWGLFVFLGVPLILIGLGVYNAN